MPERGEHDRGVFLGERIIRPERSIVEPYKPSPIGGLRYRRLVRMRPRNIGKPWRVGWWRTIVSPSLDRPVVAFVWSAVVFDASIGVVAVG